MTSICEKKSSAEVWLTQAEKCLYKISSFNQKIIDSAED